MDQATAPSATTIDPGGPIISIINESIFGHTSSANAAVVGNNERHVVSDSEQDWTSKRRYEIGIIRWSVTKSHYVGGLLQIRCYRKWVDGGCGPGSETDTIIDWHGQKLV